MIIFSVSPTLFLLATRDDVGRGDASESLVLVALIQAILYFAQRRCSSEDLTFWEGLLVAAASVTTRSSLLSLLRALPLLLAIVLLSVWFALDHDGNSSARHAGLRFGMLIIGVHKRRLRR
jgi:hypothetical protein